MNTQPDAAFMTNCRCPNRTLQSKKQGIALLAVLWMVAALSIMLAGLQQVVRGEVRIAGQVRTNAVSTGIADAAILLTLQALDVPSNQCKPSLFQSLALRLPSRQSP